MSTDELLKLVLSSKGPESRELISILNGINPPELCRISLALLSANHAALQKLERKISEQQNSRKQWWGRVTSGAIAGIVATVFLSISKVMGWIP